MIIGLVCLLWSWFALFYSVFGRSGLVVHTPLKYFWDIIAAFLPSIFSLQTLSCTPNSFLSFSISISFYLPIFFINVPGNSSKRYKASSDHVTVFLPNYSLFSIVTKWVWKLHTIAVKITGIWSTWNCYVL